MYIYTCTCTCVNYVAWTPVPSDAYVNFSKMVSHDDKVEIESSIAVDRDLKWKVFVRGKEVKDLPKSLEALPPIVSSMSDLHKIMAIFCSSTICIGNPDDKFFPLLSSKKQQFYDITGIYVHWFYIIHSNFLYLGSTITAYQDTSLIGVSTIRTVKCELLVSGRGVRCTKCIAFRRILTAMVHRLERSKNPSTDK